MGIKILLKMCSSLLPVDRNFVVLAMILVSFSGKIVLVLVQPSRLKGLNVDLHCVDWNRHDENLILTGSADNSVRLFDPCKLTSGAVGSPLHIFESCNVAVLCVQWCPNKASIFGSSAKDGILIVWDHEKVGKKKEPAGTRVAKTPPGLFFQHARHKDKVIVFHWNREDPWTIVSVSNDGENTGDGSISSQTEEEEEIARQIEYPANGETNAVVVQSATASVQQTELSLNYDGDGSISSQTGGEDETTAQFEILRDEAREVLTDVNVALPGEVSVKVIEEDKDDSKSIQVHIRQSDTELLISATCMYAIGSVAAAAKQAFIPYAEQVLELKSFLVLTDDVQLGFAHRPSPELPPRMNECSNSLLHTTVLMHCPPLSS